MTKKQAKDEFVNEFGLVLYAGNSDKATIRKCWSDFVDGLVRDGRVSETRAARWVNPVLKAKDR